MMRAICPLISLTSRTALCTSCANFSMPITPDETDDCISFTICSMSRVAMAV